MGTPEPTTTTGDTKFSPYVRPAGQAYDAERAAATGARWLDEFKPGWHDMVDTSSIFMMDVHHCIAGQVLGDEAAAANSNSGYDWVMETFGIEFTSDHGFVAPKEYWIEQIQARRAA